MEGKGEAINRFLVENFNTILRWEEKTLSAYHDGRLSVNEFHILETVFAAMADNQNTMGEIARRTGVTTGTLTTSVKTLEGKGYLRREKGEEDRRVVWLMPTAMAQDANYYHKLFHKRMVTAVMDSLDVRQLDTLIATLDILAQHFHQLERNTGQVNPLREEAEPTQAFDEAEQEF